MLVWLKKYWEWIVAGVLLLVGIFFGLSFRKTQVVLPINTDFQKKVEADTQAQTQQAQAAEQQKEQQDQKAHDTAVQNVVTQEQKAVPTQQANPQATADWLKQVGKDAKGG